MAVKPEKDETEREERPGVDLAEATVATLFFDPEHINQLVSGVQGSKDPAKVIGDALGNILLVAYNKLNKADLGVDDTVWAMEGGVIDNFMEEVLEFFQEMGLQIDPQVVAQTVLDILSNSPVGGGQEQQQRTPQPQATPAPQGVMPQ